MDRRDGQWPDAGGSQPAHSALRLRLVLAMIGVAMFVVVAIMLVALEAPVALVIVALLLAGVGLVDLGVVITRIRRGRW
jgi:hypothetical protein